MSALRDTNYYADKVAGRYPQLDPKMVRRVCRHFIRRVSNLAMDREDVLLQSARYAVKLKIFLQDYDVVRHNEQNAARARVRIADRDRRMYWNGDGPHSRPPGHKGKDGLLQIK